MSKIDKAKERLSLHPKDYTYSEAKYLLSQLGFEEFNKGKTSGSRVGFIKRDDVEKTTIFLHKPHGSDAYVRKAAIRSIIAAMERNGDIK